MLINLSIMASAIIATEFVTRRWVSELEEFPGEEVRRSYEFPEPLRHKYRQIFGEMDHDGSFVDPSEFHVEGNKLREMPGHDHEAHH